MESEPTPLQMCLATLITIFEKYARDDSRLSRDEFMVLMKTQMPDFPQDTLGEIFTCSDENQDNSMEFKEFCNLYFTFAMLHFCIIESLAEQYKEGQ